MSDIFMLGGSLMRFMNLSAYAYSFFQATKDIPKFQEQYSKVGLTPPPREEPAPSFTSHHTDTTNFTTTTNNATFNQNNFASTFVNDRAKLEKAMSFIDWLVSAAPTIGAYSNLLSFTNQVITGRQAIAELRQMNEHLGQSAAAAWSKFMFGANFPQHVYELVLSEMRSSQGSIVGDKKKLNECFFVFAEGTQWLARFNVLCHDMPLPEGFFGCFSNLDVLIALIRDVLRPAMGPEMRFTILMPAPKTTVFTEPVMLPRDIGPLCFKGETPSRNSSLVYMNLWKLEDDTVLDGIGNLRANYDDNWRDTATCATVFGTGVPYMFACVALGFIPVVGVPLTMVSWMGGGPVIISSAVEAVRSNWKIKVRTLGGEETHLYDVTDF